MTRIISPNRTIVSLLCFLGLVASMAAQTSDNTDTNTPPVENNENNETNEVAIPPAAVPIAPVNYGAQLLQPLPYQFETQNNIPTVAGPAYTGLGQIGSPLMGTSSFMGGGASLTSSDAIYSAGNLKVHFGLGYAFGYATGITTLPGQHASVYSDSVSANLSLNLGNHWTLTYSPSLPTYSSGSGFSEVVGQAVSLSGTETYEDWTFGLSDSYSFSDTPIVQTGQQTEEEANSLSLSISRPLGQDFTTAFGLSQSAVLASQFNNVYSYSGSGSLNYILNPKVMIGADVGVGYSPVSVGPSVTSESYQGVLMVRLGPRASLNLSGGIEESSYSSGGIPTETTPTFSASLSYLLGKKTSLSVSASRSLSPTFFSNQVATSTSLGASISRPLTTKLSLSVNGAYSFTSYQAIEAGPVTYYLVGNSSSPLVTTSALEVAREDRSGSIGVGLSYTLTKHLNASLSYGWSENSSTVSAFTYTSTQVGVSVGYSY